MTRLSSVTLHMSCTEARGSNTLCRGHRHQWSIYIHQSSALREAPHCIMALSAFKDNTLISLAHKTYSPSIQVCELCLLGCHYLQSFDSWLQAVTPSDLRITILEEKFSSLVSISFSRGAHLQDSDLQILASSKLQIEVLKIGTRGQIANIRNQVCFIDLPTT